MFRRFLAVGFAATLVSAWGVVQPDAVSADPVPVTFTVDSATAHPGDTVTITATFTNPETTDVTFAYLAIFATWETQTNGAYWDFDGCSGDASWCRIYGETPHHNIVAWHPTAPIAPDASRTVTLTYHIGTDSACGEGKDLTFLIYAYHETATTSDDVTVPGPTTNVAC